MYNFGRHRTNLYTAFPTHGLVERQRLGGFSHSHRTGYSVAVRSASARREYLALVRRFRLGRNQQSFGRRSQARQKVSRITRSIAGWVWSPSCSHPPRRLLHSASGASLSIAGLVRRQMNWLQKLTCLTMHRAQWLRWPIFATTLVHCQKCRAGWYLRGFKSPILSPRMPADAATAASASARREYLALVRRFRLVG